MIDHQKILSLKGSSAATDVKIGGEASINKKEALRKSVQLLQVKGSSAAKAPKISAET